MMRGIERRDVFRDERDREDFCERLSELLPESGFSCFGWALMPNHVHLLLRTGPVPLSQVMKRLNTGYATRFNKRHGRSGYLFQNRFKSRLAVDDADLMNLVRYVNGNPLKDGLVASVDALAAFPWSGFAALVGMRPARPFETTEPVLQLFDSSPEHARTKLRGWMGEAEGKEVEAPFEPQAPARPVTGGDEREHPARSFDTLVADVCHHFGLLPGELIGSSKRRVVTRARATLCFLASSEARMSGAEISRRLGVHDSSVAKCVRRGRGIAQREGLGPSGRMAGLEGPSPPT